MNIELTYTIIPCADTVIASHFYNRIFNFKSVDETNKESLVQVNEKLTLKLEENEEYTNTQFTFEVDDEYFDLILKNIKKEKLLFGSSITDFENKKVYEDFQKKEFYFLDPNSHLFNIITFIKD